MTNSRRGGAEAAVISSSSRARGDEDEEGGTGGGAVGDPVLAAGRAKRNFTRAQLARLGADAHLYRAFQHGVQLVAARVGVRFLFLPGLQAVDVAEEAIRLEQVQLLQLVGREAAQGRE